MCYNHDREIQIIIIHFQFNLFLPYRFNLHKLILYNLL